MVFYGENSWKKKIDPAFDKSVKTYLKFLCEVDRLPNDGQVTFNEESIELIRKNNNLSADYENESETEILHFTHKIGLITEQECNVFLNTLTAIEKYNIFLKGLQKAGPKTIISRFSKSLYLRFSILRKITYLNSS